MYAIVFDLDQETVGQHGNGPHNADAEIARFLTARGSEWKQGSVYFGDQTIDAVRGLRTVQKLAKKYDWFTPALKDVRMLRIEESNDLKIALDDDES